MYNPNTIRKILLYVGVLLYTSRAWHLALYELTYCHEMSLIHGSTSSVQTNVGPITCRCISLALIPQYVCELTHFSFSVATFRMKPPFGSAKFWTSGFVCCFACDLNASIQLSHIATSSSLLAMVHLTQSAQNVLWFILIYAGLLQCSSTCGCSYLPFRNVSSCYHSVFFYPHATTMLCFLYSHWQYSLNHALNNSKSAKTASNYVQFQMFLEANLVSQLPHLTVRLTCFLAYRNALH